MMLPSRCFGSLQRKPTQTSDTGARVSTFIVFWMTAERPSSRNVTRRRYCPSRTRRPASVVPSQFSRSGL